MSVCVATHTHTHTHTHTAKGMARQAGMWTGQQHSAELAAAAAMMQVRIAALSRFVHMHIMSGVCMMMCTTNKASTAGGLKLQLLLLPHACQHCSSVLLLWAVLPVCVCAQGATYLGVCWGVVWCVPSSSSSCCCWWQPAALSQQQQLLQGLASTCRHMGRQREWCASATVHVRVLHAWPCPPPHPPKMACARGRVRRPQQQLGCKLLHAA